MSQPTNMCFIYKDWIKDASLSLVSGAADSAFPLDWLKSSLLAEGLKTSGTGNIEVLADLGQERYCAAVVLPGITSQPDTKVTFTLYEDAGVTPLDAHTFDTIGWIKSIGEGRVGDYTVYPSAEELAAMPGICPAYFFTGRYVRYMGMSIKNGATAADIFSIGRWLCGDYWEVAINPKWGITYGPKPLTRSNRTPAGVPFANVKPDVHYLKFTLDGMADYELLGHFKQLAVLCGNKRDFVVILDSRDERYKRHFSIYGRFTDESASSLASMDLNNQSSVEIEIVESPNE